MYKIFFTLTQTWNIDNRVLDQREMEFETYADAREWLKEHGVTGKC